MNVCLTALALWVGCVGAPAPPSDPGVPVDAWLAEDKLRHFALSFAATEMAYGGARLGLDHEQAVPAAAAAAFVLGLAKEVRDTRGGGAFSLKDLTWDLAGVALGVALVRKIR